jgi:putative acetyltransferase
MGSAATAVITIRPYADTDLAALTSLFRASVRDIASRDYTASQIREWAPDHIDERRFAQKCESRPTWVAEVEGRIAGFSDLEPDGHVDMLYVHPDLQRRGVARALLKHVEEAARTAGLRRLYTEASITARAVFEAIGFRAIGPQTVTIRSVSMTNYRMEKSLEPSATTSHMSLVQEYHRQFPWRDWSRALALCPIRRGQRVLDLGCGPGDLSAELAVRGLAVTGIDHDPELLAAARERAPDAHFEQQDLSDLTLPPNFDGIWCSFTAAYFVDFDTTFARWCTALKPTAWVCLIDIDDLLGHEPRSNATRDTIERFYGETFEKRRYDFRVGRRLASVLENQGFQVTIAELADRELAFDGPASPEVLKAWLARFARMGGLKSFLGNGFADFTGSFIRALESPQHQALCKVVCCVGRRG